MTTDRRRRGQTRPEHHPFLRTTADLEAAGMTQAERAVAVATGDLERVCKGRYVPGHVDNDLRRLVAAAGPTAALFRHTAAQAWDLEGYPFLQPLRVCVPFTSGMRGPGIVRVRHDPMIVWLDGLPVTSVADTLVDIGACKWPLPRFAGDPFPISAAERVELALEHAILTGLVTVADLRAVIARSSYRRPRRRLLRDLLDERGDTTPPTESHLETRFVQLLRRHGLPPMQRQVEVRRPNRSFLGRVDFLLGNVIVEVDGRSTHDDRLDQDRQRWSELTSLGYAVQVFTYDHIERAGHMVVETFRRTLRRSGVLQPRPERGG